MPGQDIAINAAGAFAQAVLTAGAFALVRRYAPVKNLGVDPETLAALRKKYAWFEVAGLLPMFAWWAGITWALYQVLRWASDRTMGARGHAAAFVLKPEPAALFLPAFFLAILLSAFPMMFLARLLLGPTRYRESSLASRYGQGYDAVRGVALLAALIVPAAVGLAVLLMDHYAVVTRSELVVNPFWGLTEHRRPLGNVVAVYEVATLKAPGGKVVAKPFYQVRFRDGSTWSTRDGVYGSQPALERRVALFVAERAGVGVQRVRSLPPPG